MREFEPSDVFVSSFFALPKVAMGREWQVTGGGDAE